MSAAIQVGDSLDHILDGCVEAIGEVLEAKRVSIMMTDTATGHLRIRAAHGIPRDVWAEVSIAPGEGVVGRVLTEGMPLIHDANGADPAACEANPHGKDSFASVPLSAHERVLGALSVSDPSPPEKIDLSPLLAAAALVSLAVESANRLASALTLQDHLSEVLCEMTIGVICADQTATVTLCNPVAGGILEITASQAIGHPLETVLPRGIRAVILSMIDEARETRRHTRREISLPRHGDPATMPVRVGAMVLRDEADTVEATVVVLEDLTLGHEVAELRRLDELKSNFLAMVSHELRTPLTSIKGAVHLLESEALKDEPEQRRSLHGLMRKNTDRLIAQINNILDVNQLEHHTLTLFLKPTVIPEIIARVLERRGAEFQDKGVRVEIDLPTLPIITADPERVEQIFDHLLDNALKFTPTGGEVRVWAEADGEQVAVHLHDTGIGLDPKCHDAVFKKFFQLEHTLTRQAGGNGLGLFLAKGFAELHGGDIQFVSTTTVGTEVVVTLPLRAQGDTDAGARDQSEGGQEP